MFVGIEPVTSAATANGIHPMRYPEKKVFHSAAKRKKVALGYEP